MPSEYNPGLLLVGCHHPATHLVVRGHPKAKRTKRSLETVTWPRTELGYSNNRLDDEWRDGNISCSEMGNPHGYFLRALCKPMEGRQRLNGCAVLIDGCSRTRDAVRYSPASTET